jgi:hypothetical protein
MIWGYETSVETNKGIGFVTAPAGVVPDSGKWKMALLDDIRSHLAVANEDQRKRRGAVLLRQAAAEIERLRSIAPSDSDSPQAIHARESQRLQPDRTPDAASTPGEGTSHGGRTEPVAWVAFADDASESGVTALNREAVEEVAARHGWHVAPLYRSPECPYVTGKTTRHCTLTPFTLTDAEREAIVTALAYLREDIDEKGIEIDAAALRGLLERTRHPERDEI